MLPPSQPVKPCFCPELRQGHSCPISRGCYALWAEGLLVGVPDASTMSMDTRRFGRNAPDSVDPPEVHVRRPGACIAFRPSGNLRIYELSGDGMPITASRGRDHGEPRADRGGVPQSRRGVPGDEPCAFEEPHRQPRRGVRGVDSRMMIACDARQMVPRHQGRRG